MNKLLPKRIRRKIRHLNRVIKNTKNEAKAHRDAATYYQAIADYITDKYHLPPTKEG